jgi:hypothetical protein
MSTPWLFEAALIGLITALNYGTLKEGMLDATATLLEGACIFFLVMTTNVLLRQCLLLLLLSSGHNGIVENSIIRLALLFFPSTRPAGQAAESVSTALFSARSDNACPPVPAIKRSYTSGGGALPESVTTEELPAVSGEDDFDAVSTFKSVLFIDGQHAARVALPPVSACLLVASNVWLGLATSNMWLGDRLGIKAVLPIEAAPWPMMQIGLIFRLLIPFDVALIAVIGDLVVANNVSTGVRPGFYYLAVAMRCILWSLSMTGTLSLLGFSSGGGGVFTAYGLLGVGLTLSLQQTAKDLLSTLQLFLTRPYDVGDEIDAGNGHHGWVINVGWRFTTL